jgi:hypothetical protein
VKERMPIKASESAPSLSRLLVYSSARPQSDWELESLESSGHGGVAEWYWKLWGRQKSEIYTEQSRRSRTQLEPRM